MTTHVSTMHTNDRGEEPFEGVRAYPCSEIGCRQCEAVHELEWMESVIHTASEVRHDVWGVRVFMTYDTSGWAVSSYFDDAWPTDRATGNAFTTALGSAFDLADRLTIEKARRMARDVLDTNGTPSDADAGR